MTDRRDLKRRVRDRQAHTGESYMVALRQVQAQRPGLVPIVELVDVTEVGAGLGMRCRIAMFPQLRETLDAPATLGRLREVLQATAPDRTLDGIRSVVLRGARPDVEWSADMIDEWRRFLERARAGVGGVSDSGNALALAGVARGGAPDAMAVFVVWPVSSLVAMDRPPLLIIASPGDLVGDLGLDGALAFRRGP